MIIGQIHEANITLAKLKELELRTDLTTMGEHNARCIRNDTHQHLPCMSSACIRFLQETLRMTPHPCICDLSTHCAESRLSRGVTF